MLVWQASHSIPFGLWTEVCNSSELMYNERISPLGSVRERSELEWQLKQYSSVCCFGSLAWEGETQIKLSRIRKPNSRNTPGIFLMIEDFDISRPSLITILITFLK